MSRKYFESEQEILDKIESNRQKAAELLKEAEATEEESRQLYALGPHMAETAGYKKEDARKMRIKSSNIIEKAIPKLGLKLSEIRTKPMPFLDGTQQGIGDASVEVKAR